MTLTIDGIEAAAARIAPHVLRTPLLYSPEVSGLLGRRVSLKYELFQRTNSFKVRGAFNKMLQLTPAERERGLVAVSGGNHGKAVAYAARELGLRATIVMFQNAAASTVQACQAYGARVELLPTAADAFTRAFALQNEGATLIHPFDDPAVIAGQGTLGLEILADAPDVTDVVISIGGGGMFGGVAAAIKARRPEVRLWGVETEGADAMNKALIAGKPVPLGAMTSVATTLGAPEVSELTLALMMRHYQTRFVVPDHDVVLDLLWLLERAKVLVEPAAACTLTAAKRLGNRFKEGQHVVLILCGGSITMDELSSIRGRVGV